MASSTQCLKSTELIQRITSTHSSLQLEQLQIFLPDHLIKNVNNLKTDTNFSNNIILLLIEVSGLTEILSNHDKTTNTSKIDGLTSIVNGFVACIYEIIQYYGGDLLTFDCKKFLAYWNGSDSGLNNVMLSTLHLNGVIEEFKNNEIELKIKFGVSYGDLDLFIVGDDYVKNWVIYGDTLDSVKTAMSLGEWNDVVVSPEVFKRLSNCEDYNFSLISSCGFAKVNSIKHSNEDNQIIFNELCGKHLKFWNKSDWEGNVETKSINYDLNNEIIEELKPFLNPLLQDALENNPNLLFLNEIRTLTIVVIDIVTGYCNKDRFKVLIKQIYDIISNIFEKHLGILIQFSCIETDLMIILGFGFESTEAFRFMRKGLKHMDDCKNALLASQYIYKAINLIDVKNVSIGVSYAPIYYGIIGHLKRKNFIILGKAFDNAALLSKKFRNKITCDYLTMKNSHLSWKWFKIINNKYISNIFEFNQPLKDYLIYNKIDLIGRDEEYDLIWSLIENPGMYGFYGLCFCGPKMIGKTKLLMECYKSFLTNDFSVAFVDLCQCTQKPYGCLSRLYKEFYDKVCFDDDLRQFPFELWDLNEILQQKESYDKLKEKIKILSVFREIVKRNRYRFSVIFIDNIQFIDLPSLDILETLICENSEKFKIGLICCGEFDLDSNIRWRLSLNDYIKLIDLKCFNEESIVDFVSKIFQGNGVEKNLVCMLKNNCDGSPGVIKHFVKELHSKGYIKSTKKDFVISKDQENFFFNLKTKNENRCFQVIELNDVYEINGEITEEIVLMNIIGELESNDFIILICCVMLGEIVSRKSLFKFYNNFLENPSKNNFNKGLKRLFSLKFIECGAYLSSINLQKNCLCPHNKENLSEPYCKMIHFRNLTIKRIIYNLIKHEDKFKMHRNIINSFNFNEIKCLNCAKNNCLPINHGLKSNFNRNVALYFGDSILCSCLEMNLQIYHDLIEHTKIIETNKEYLLNLIDYSNILILIKEHEEALSFLFKAAISYKKLNCSEPIIIAKINMLIAKAFGDSHDDLTKEYLIYALKCFLSAKGKSLIKDLNLDEIDFIIECLNLITKYFIKIKNWNVTKTTSDLLFNILKITKPSKICFETASTLIKVYTYLNEHQSCKSIILRAQKQITRTTISSIPELLTLTTLIKDIFYNHLLNAQLLKSIKLGYKLINLCESINVILIKQDVLTSLSWILMLVKRIEDSAEIINTLKDLTNIPTNLKDEALLFYYTICLELLLETSFILEPYQNIHNFCIDYFKLRQNSDYTPTEKTILLYLFNHHLRNNRWVDSSDWKNYLNFNEFDPIDLQSTKNLFKYTENLLIVLAKNDREREVGNKDFKLVKKYLGMCQIASEKFKLFVPRYYHFKSYLLRILGKRNKSVKCLNLAFKLALADENTLEYCWLMQSRNFWDGGFSFEGDRKYVEWVIANTYSPVHWSQILYGLPLYNKY
ncbi:adenylate cyclase type 10-like [Onthophagus taurus]|uniref:adenylate cyclase type 10-like n=1 Tax=Onthophagus taurus TaxID=166361 RepID=UPI0039BE65EF